MSNLENSFKEAFTDFDQVSPSKGLWNRIAMSLFLKSYAFKAILLSMIAFVIVFPTYLYFSNTQNNTNLISTKTDISKNKSNKSDNRINTSQIESTEASNQVNDWETQTTSIQPKESIAAETLPSQARQNKSSRKAKSQYSQQAQKTEQKSSEIVVQASAPKSEEHNTKVIANVLIAQPKAASLKNNTNTSIKKVNYASDLRIIEEGPNKANINMIESMPLFSEFANTTIYHLQAKPSSHYNMMSSKLMYSSQIEIFAGPNIAFNQLKTTDDQYREHINLRQSSESPKLSYHAGINYKTYHNHWFMGIGINYHRIEDYATYSLPIVDVDSVISSYLIFQNTYNQVITGYIQNPNDTNSLIPIIETQVTQDTTVVSNVYYDSTKTTKSYSFTNTYSYIEVPIMIGREFRLKQFVFDVQAGVSWGRLIKTEVNIPNNKNDQMLNNQELETVFVKNTFNGLIGLGVGYQMNESFILFARPEMRYNLNNMFENNNPINQKYLQLRLSLGVRIQL